MCSIYDFMREHTLCYLLDVRVRLVVAYVFAYVCKESAHLSSFESSTQFAGWGVLSSRLVHTHTHTRVLYMGVWL